MSPLTTSQNWQTLCRICIRAQGSSWNADA